MNSALKRLVIALKISPTAAASEACLVNWTDLCDSVTDNFRVINPKDFRVMT